MQNQPKTLTQQIVRQYAKNKMACFGLTMIGVFFAISFLAPVFSWLVGISHNDQNVFNRYQSLFSRADFMNADSQALTVLHLLGTDELGRDVFLRLIYGTQVSIGIGICVGLLALFIGTLIGTLAGYYGGKIDTVLMRLTDSMLSLPLIPILIVLAAIDLKKIALFDMFVSASNESIIKMIFILCLFSWMTIARLVRGTILSIKGREYIQAAKMMGAGDFRIMTRHVLPNAVGPMLVAVSLVIGQAILIEAGLSFLGLGVQPPTPSWGNMLFNAQELIYEAPSLAVFPGILILLAVMSFNFIGDGLQDALNPKTQ